MTGAQKLSPPTDDRSWYSTVGGKLVAAFILAAALTVPASAGEKLSPAFRAAFEKSFKTGRTYAVVVQEGVPTTSVYGVDGKSSSTAHYSIDVVDGKWKTSSGLLDFDQTAADFLNKGEVMEVAAISYKENRLDLRMGPTFTKEYAGPRSEKGEWLVGVDYEWTISKRSSLQLSNDFYVEGIPNAGEFRNLSLAEWTLTIVEQPELSLKIGGSNEYDSSPDPEDQPNDLRYYLAIGLGF